MKKNNQKNSTVECNRKMRFFVGVFLLQLVTLIFILAFIGHFISIPFVPTMLFIRVPALILFTVIYVFIVLLCLNQQRVIPFLNKEKTS